MHDWLSHPTHAAHKWLPLNISAGACMHMCKPTYPEDLHFYLWGVYLAENTFLTLTWREVYRYVSGRLIQSEVVLKWKYEGTREDVKKKTQPHTQQTSHTKQLLRTKWELTFLSMSIYHVYSPSNRQSIRSNLLKVLQKPWCADSKAFKHPLRDTWTLIVACRP